MKHVINKSVALRSWERIPYACYVWGRDVPLRLEPDEFALLATCDGEHEQEPSALLQSLISRGFAHKAAPGETWDAWSAPRVFENRLFHSLNWAITGKCNLNCRHCFMAADNAPMLGEFSWDECLCLLDGMEAAGIQNVTLTGGEPMLHPRFLDLVRECTRRHLRVGELNTNGTRLTAEVLQEFRALGQDIEIKISFDGIGHHDWLRGTHGCEEKALAAMRLAKEQGFSVRAQTNVHKGNLDVMLPTLELLDSMGVDEVRVIRTTETPRWRENSEHATLGLTEYYDKMLQLMEGALARNLKLAVDVWQFVYYNPRTRTYGFHPVQICRGHYRDTVPACKGVRGDVGVSYTGEVYPCNQLSGTFAAMGVSFGNVHTTPLSELLRTGAYHDCVMMPVREVREHNELCQRCPYWRACTGGCRAIATALTKDYRHFDPAKCAFFFGGYLARTDELLAPRGYQCITPTEDEAIREGDPAMMGRIREKLGAYA